MLRSKKIFHLIFTDRNIQYVLAWKRGNAVLTAGSVKVTMNPRIRLIPVHELPEISSTSMSSHKSPTGYNLELRDVRVTDAGDYACQIGTLEPQEIIHKLEVLVPPKIDFISPSGGRLDVAKGSPIRLECRGSGNPTPKIYWSRKVKKKSIKEIHTQNKTSTKRTECLFMLRSLKSIF